MHSSIKTISKRIFNKSPKWIFFLHLKKKNHMVTLNFRQATWPPPILAKSILDEHEVVIFSCSILGLPLSTTSLCTTGENYLSTPFQSPEWPILLPPHNEMANLLSTFTFINLHLLIFHCQNCVWSWGVSSKIQRCQHMVVGCTHGQTFQRAFEWTYT